MMGAVHVANSILLKAEKENNSITPNKLYYLVYLFYSHALYNGLKLFNEPFSITDLGPIVPSLYYKFNSYGDKKIKSYATNALGETFYINSNVFDMYLEKVWLKYKYFYEIELYNLITKVDSAYDKAKKRNNLVLNDEDILNEQILKNENILKKAKTFKRNIN